MRNSQHMEQKLKLSPQMLITAELIQKSVLELEMVLKKELRINPFLRDLSSDEQSDEIEIIEEIEELQDMDDEGDLSDQIKQLNKIINDIDEVTNAQFSYERSDRARKSSEDNDEYETAKENVWDNFVQQVHELGLTSKEQQFADTTLKSLDAHGYLDASLDELYEQGQLKPERAEEIHSMIMKIYPRGIGARNLTECLLAQLDEEVAAHPVIISIIQEDLQALQNRKYESLLHKYHIPLEELITIKNIISHLDPKPGSRITNSTSSYIKPDIIVKEIDGNLEVIVNDTNIPEISVNKEYAQRLLEQARDKNNAIKYIRSKLLAAENYVKALWMRRETLLRITNELIKQQPTFFLQGKKILQPMTYDDVAKKIKRDVSTICRVVNNYYIETPIGLFLMKWFFNSKVGDFSSQQIKQEIQKIVDAENKKKPLSDQKITKKLAEKDIQASLRVVAKYRNQLGIPASRLRKQHL